MSAAAGVPLVATRGLSKTYRTGGGEVTALEDVSVSIAAGEFVAVTGASGSGKSTFMHLVGALDVPSRGSIAVDGCELARLGEDELARFRNRSVGFVFQQFNLLPGATALENVALPLLYAGESVSRTARLERARAALERVGLAERASHRPTELSGGQQQRVAIARALVAGPKLLLADEPTGALDTATSVEIMNLFEELNRDGTTLVVVTHEPDIAARARRQLRFRDGRLTLGSP